MIYNDHIILIILINVMESMESIEGIEGIESIESIGAAIGAYGIAPQVQLSKELLLLKQSPHTCSPSLKSR